MPGPHLEHPDEKNRFHEAHMLLVLESLKKLSGRDLLAEWNLPGTKLGEEIFFGEFYLLTHDGTDEALLNYANKCALDAFEMNWEQFQGMPSSHTARAENQKEREKMMRRVREEGFVTGYEGLRVTRNNREFWIRNGIIWQISAPDDANYGVAAYFTDIEMV